MCIFVRRDHVFICSNKDTVQVIVWLFHNCFTALEGSLTNILKFCRSNNVLSNDPLYGYLYIFTMVTFFLYILNSV